EQIRGEQLDARTDIFSFGLVLYEMATGQRAFSAETEAALHEATVHASPIPVSKLKPDIPAQLATTIDKALQKKREQRYQTAGEMRADLEKVRPAAGATDPKARIMRGRVWVMAVALLIVIAGTAFLYWRHRPAFKLVSGDTILIAEFANLTSDPTFND